MQLSTPTLPFLVRGVLFFASCFLVVACNNSTGPDSDASDGPTSARLTSNQAIDGTVKPPPDTASAVQPDVSSVPLPGALAATRVRAGYVALAWGSAAGDSEQSHPYDDSVSYYRVYKDGVHFIDALSPFIEDTDASAGLTLYRVESVKFESSPNYRLVASDSVELLVDVPTALQESSQTGSKVVGRDAITRQLQQMMQCQAVHALVDNTSVCYNDFGLAWSVDGSGNPGELFPATKAVNAFMIVDINHGDNERGPVPELPRLSVMNMLTGIKEQHSLSFSVELEKLRERPTITGVTLSSDNRLYLSGRLYQSFVQRSLGPGVSVLPVTSGYFLAELDADTFATIRFQRYTLDNAPGTLMSGNAGVLKAAHIGQLAHIQASDFAVESTMPVVGMPVLVSDVSIFSESAQTNQIFQLDVR